MTMTNENPVAQIRRINDQGDRYESIVLWCPGCEHDSALLYGHKVGGLHMLPISGDGKKRPTWQWNRDMVTVTLSPSILTQTTRGEEPFVCHSFLQESVWHFLEDSTHPLAGQHVPMVPLPDWVVRD